MSTIIGDIITIGGSSDSGDIYALISVTYPSGSTCTATNGTTILTAANTSGKVVFAIPEPASKPETWTVSCADNDDNDSATVSISTYGQVEEVELQYVILISFTIGSHGPYFAEQGMTLASWAASPYNTDGWIDNGVLVLMPIDEETFALSTTVIEDGYHFKTIS